MIADWCEYIEDGNAVFGVNDRPTSGRMRACRRAFVRIDSSRASKTAGGGKTDTAAVGSPAGVSGTPPDVSSA